MTRKPLGVDCGLEGFMESLDSPIKVHTTFTHRVGLVINYNITRGGSENASAMP